MRVKRQNKPLSPLRKVLASPKKAYEKRPAAYRQRDAAVAIAAERESKPEPAVLIVETAAEERRKIVVDRT